MSIFCLTLISSGCQRDPEIADVILKNGVFFTVDKERPLCQAVALKKDRIVAVGDDTEMEIHQDSTTRVIDLNGQFACPGFNDAHVHLIEAGLCMTEIDLKGMRTIREIQTAVRQKVRRLEPGEWVVGRGWDQTLFEGQRMPTKRILDQVSSYVPIYLKRCGLHTALVNSEALRIAGITDKTVNPPGGEIEKDPNTGHPTGILKDSAMELVSQYIESPSAEQKKKAAEIALEAARQYGITSLQDNSSIDAFDIFKDLLDEGKLTCRISEWYPLQDDLSTAKKLKKEYDDPMLRFGLLKGFMDGSLGSRSAALLEPYLDDPDNRGILMMSPENLRQQVIEADRDGFQLGIHAIGDWAVRETLEAFAFAQRMNGKRDSRHRIEHAQILTDVDLIRFSELDVIASMQPFHCIDDLRWVESRLGTERCRLAYLWKSLRAQSHIALGTDWPVVPLNPMQTLYASVARKDTTGFPSRGWMTAERLTIEEAIEAYTLGSAYAEFMDHEKGSLTPGKLADIVILNVNLLEATPEEIRDAAVVMTIVGGNVVYKRE